MVTNDSSVEVYGVDDLVPGTEYVIYFFSVEHPDDSAYRGSFKKPDRFKRLELINRQLFAIFEHNGAIDCRGISRIIEPR